MIKRRALAFVIMILSGCSAGEREIAIDFASTDVLETHLTVYDDGPGVQINSL